jgi:TPP-dependent pyruvate/acetoin dehydrogenase alpha subunit
VSSNVDTIKEASAALSALSPTPFDLPIDGIEAVIAGGFVGMQQGDWVFAGLRERVGVVLRGCPVERLENGFAGAKPYRLAPVSTSPAARMLHACGMSMAKGDDSHVLCFIGQGSAATGEFHEALNLAALHNLNVVFLAHSWDLSSPESPLAKQTAVSLSALSTAYGIEGVTVSGADEAAVTKAVSSARKKGGPQLIEAQIER